MVRFVIYPGDAGNQLLGNGVLIQDYIVPLSRNSFLCGRNAGKISCLLILLLDGKCVIGFVIHLLTRGMDLRLLGNQWSRSDGEKHVMIKVCA